MSVRADTPGRLAPRLAPGEVVLDRATRSFSVRADRGRTLKGLLIGRRASGPAPIPALREVSLRIAPGETVGIVGRNGAGKSSTLRVLAGIIPLQSGEAACGGRIVSLLELGAGFSRDFSGRENIHLQGALYGFSRAQVEERLDEIIAFSELGDFIDVPVKTYSAGMFVRLGFSIAAHLDADVLLIDEVLAVGDDAFQRKCLERISTIIGGGATLVLVSHDLGSIERVCSRLVVLDGGRVVFDGPVAEGLLHYRRLMGTEHERGRSLRHESGAVEILEFELQDLGGRSAMVFAPGDPMRIVVELRSRAPLGDPALALEISAREGTSLFRTVTGVELEEDGRTRLSYEIPRLTLLGGDFSVSARAGERGELEGLPAQRTTAFAVAEVAGAEGPVDLRGAWVAVNGVGAGAGPAVRGGS